MKLNARQLRKGSRIKAKIAKKLVKKNDIYIILDNVLDTYNIGSIFRLADAVAAKKIYLCGGSEIPPNHRIKKASINTTEVVDWQYFENTVDGISDLRKNIKNIQIIAVEQTDNAVQYDQFEYRLPIAIVLGHETDGVSRKVLESCDGVVDIPMFGVNVSLNVMVSSGIILYKILEKNQIKD